MNDESPFFQPSDDSCVEFYRATSGDYQSVELSAPHEEGGDGPTLDDAAAAIAGVLHLYEKPTEDLHRYTDYLEEVKEWMVSRETKGITVEYRPRDPLAALGL